MRVINTDRMSPDEHFDEIKFRVDFCPPHQALEWVAGTSSTVIGHKITTFTFLFILIYF